MNETNDQLANLGGSNVHQRHCLEGVCPSTSGVVARRGNDGARPAHALRPFSAIEDTKKEKETQRAQKEKAKAITISQLIGLASLTLAACYFTCELQDSEKLFILAFEIVLFICNVTVYKKWIHPAP